MLINVVKEFYDVMNIFIEILEGSGEEVRMVGESSNNLY